MKITCNGEKRELSPGTTLIAFIRDMDLNPDTVVAECDGNIVGRDDYDDLILQEGCVLELIRFVGGG